MSLPLRSYFPKIFGQTVQVKIIDTLCYLQFNARRSGEEWINISNLAEKAQVAKSSAKRIIDNLLVKEILEEKKIQTHAQNPPRKIRLNNLNPIVKEILFFYRKVRGFL